MEIIKRDGRREAFDINKIANAIRKSLESTGGDYSHDLPISLAEEVSRRLGGNGSWAVEEIQDIVEEVLMASGEFQAAKSFILFRNARTQRRKERARILEHFSDKSLEPVLAGIQHDFPEDGYSLSILADKLISFSKPGMSEEEEAEAIIRAAVELTGPQAPRWEFIASRFLLFSFRRSLSRRLAEKGIGSFYEKLCYLTDEGLYGAYIKEGYSKAEIEEAAGYIDEERDKLFTYSDVPWYRASSRSPREGKAHGDGKGVL